MEVTLVEQCSYIKIVVPRGNNAMEYHSESVEALGNNALPYRTVAWWVYCVVILLHREDHIVLRGRGRICVQERVKSAHGCSAHNFDLFFRINSRKRHMLSTKSSLFTVHPSRINSRSTMSWISKNTSSMTFPLGQSWQNFCLRGDFGDFHVVDAL
ncbi:hypothetical protein TNCV_97661 [Trichonephila clavipes]|nr:hypothetical protein TNCV_97661 [Trichonephila clavipes]